MESKNVVYKNMEHALKEVGATMHLIGFKRVHPDAKLPMRAKEGDAGADLSSIEDLVIEPHKSAIVKTGLVWEPEHLNYELQVRPRSGLAVKNVVTVLNSPGTIDGGFRGEIGVILINHSDVPFEIKKGDRIAQAVIQPIHIYRTVEIEEISETERGCGKYGSTGR